MIDARTYAEAALKLAEARLARAKRALAQQEPSRWASRAPAELAAKVARCEADVEKFERRLAAL
jgi:hypothetical protein